MAFDPNKVDLGSLSQISPGNQVDDIVGDNQNFNMSEAVKVDPDQHAKELDLSKRSGVPVIGVQSDAITVEQDIKKSQFDFSEISKTHPATANRFNNIDDAIIAQDDIDVMQSIEDGLTATGEYFSDIAGGFEKGQLMVESSEIGLGSMYSALGVGEAITDDQITRLKEIKALTKQGDEEYGFLAGAPIAAAEQLPIMYEIIRTGVGYGIAGAGVGFGIAKLPGAAAGARIGGRTGVAKAAFDLEAGLAFNEFSALKDEKGNLMNPQVAAGAAVTVGAINASLEFISLAALGRTVTPVMRSVIKSKIKKSLATETGRQMITRLLKDYGIAVGTETVTESAQEFTNVIGAELAKHIDEDSFTEQDLSSTLDNIFSGETAERVVEAGEKGAQASLVFGGVGTTVSVIVETRQRERLSENEQLRIDSLNADVENSKLRERGKESFKQFVEEADGENNTHVFIDGAQAAMYLQSKTPEEIQADPALTLLSKETYEASALGGDVSVPVADFAAEIAGTEHYEQLRDTMTLSGESVSPFRQEQVQKETESYIKVLMEEAQQNASEYVEAQEIYDTVREQLVDSGQVNAANASIMAQVVPAWATAQARRSGKTVQQVYQDSGLVIEGPQTGEAARIAGEQILEQRAVTKEDLQTSLQNEGVDVQLTGKGDVVTLSKIVVPEDQRDAGVGTAAMQRITTWADANGKTIALSPSKDFGGTVGRLKKFYKGLGFIENKGRNKNLEISETMIREPQLPVDAVVAEFMTELREDHVASEAENKARLERVLRGEVYDQAPVKPTSIDPNIFRQRPGAKPEARGYYDPENSVIRLTEAADLSTFLHEFAHFMYEMEVNGDTDMLKSINNWYKSNADVVAKESNGYLGEEFDALKQSAPKRGDKPAFMTFTDDAIQNIINRPGSTLKNTKGDEFPTSYVSRVPIDEFLYLTTDESFTADQIAREGPRSSERSELDTSMFKPEEVDVSDPADLPKLNIRVHFDGTASIVGHEGRHRAALLKRDGGTTIPVIINIWNRDDVVELIESPNDIQDFDIFIGQFDKVRRVPAFKGVTASKENIDEMRKIVGDESIPSEVFAQPTDQPTAKEGSITADDVVAFLDQTTTGDKDKDAAIRRAVHEQFARGFETYLMEGKAPSIELRNAFRAFARWLTRIYQSLRNQLDVNLDDNIREVFDRLLATEEQIVAAESRARVEPMFTDAAMAGMTEEEFAKYQKQQEKVKDVQTETLRDKIIKQLTRQTEKWWGEEKQDIINEEIDTLKTERVYAAREQLKAPTSKKEFDEIIEKSDKELVDIDSQIKTLVKENDTVGQFISKKGGLNRESMSAEGVDPEHFKDKIKVFGKPLFPRKGGMTSDDLAEKLNEEGYKGGNLTANDALEIVFEMLSDDSSFINPEVTAEIDSLESHADVVERDKIEIEQESQRVNLKLDHATVKEMVGEKKTNKLGRTSIIVPSKLTGMTAKGMQGVHPDEAAMFLGYDSGAQMLKDLLEAAPIGDRAEVNAEARMIERHGDILTDGTIEREADEAVQSEERGKLILNELKTLAKGTNVPTIDRAAIKALAETNIGKLSFREIHPAKYRRAEIRAAQEASRMLAEGNRDGAAAAKMRQVMNYYLGMEASNAKNETMKIVDRMARYNKKKMREAIIRAENGYWDQINKILSRFEFRKTATLKEVESINTWMKERMESDGDGLVLSNVVLDESYVTHWKNVPFSDLQGINDSVKNIEHVARYANKIKLQQEEIDFKKLKQQWVDHINEQDQRFATKESRSRIDDSREATAMEHVRKWASQLTKVPFLASWLDGGERTGLSQDILVQQFTDALDAKIKMVDEIATPVMKLIQNRSKADQQRHNTKIWIPEIDDHLMGHQVLAVALNTGNQGNLKKMLLGEGWADPDVETDVTFDNSKLQAVLAHMTKSDWELVQKIWDQMDLLYPQLAEVHRRTTGLTPPKVAATPIITKYGTFRGGYYPVKYSPERSHKAEKNAEKRDAETESMFNNTASIQSSVNTGATNERTGFYDRIYLSLEVVPDHFNETIHYITHHDAVRQINRLLQAPEIVNAITGVLGEEEFKQLKPWLNDVAKDGRQQPVKTYIDTAFQRLRFGTTLGVMGFKASTGIMQVFGLLTTAAELGAGPTMQGIFTTVGRSWYMKSVRNLLGSRDDLQTGWEFATERSKVMSHRALTMDREIKNAMDRLRGKTGLVAAVQEASMKHIALIQTYMVDLPTWHAVYNKEISESGDEAKAIKRADWSVENLQGSGATKNMAMILRNQSKIHTTFTMFMTFFSSLGNLSRDLVKGRRTGIYSATSVAAKLMFLFTLPVFLEMLMRGNFDEPEGEDERLGKFVTSVALYPLTSVPFVRDVAGGLIGDFGYNSSPVASVLEKGIQGVKQIGERAFTDDEITKSAIKNTSKVAAAAAGIPGINQVWATGEHLYDVIEEGEDLTARELLFGPDRK